MWQMSVKYKLRKRILRDKPDYAVYPGALETDTVVIEAKYWQT